MSEILLEEDEGFVDDLGLDVKTVEEWLNQVSYEDDPDYVPSDFAQAFVSFIKLVSGGQGEENVTPVLHLKMLDQIDQPNSRKIANMVHRGAAKTTVLGEYLILYLATFGELPTFGQVDFALYVSDSIDNGVKNMRKNLEYRWENSEFLKKYVPHAKFTDIHWHFKNKEGKEFIVKGYGAKTGVRGTKANGKRPQLAILDDLVSDEDARSKTMIAAIEDTVHKAIDHAMHPTRSKIIWSGTPFNASDPLYKAIESGAWAVNCYPVCEKFPCTRAEFRGSWEDRFTYDYVKRKYLEALKSGTIHTFNQELMLRIMSDEGKRVSRDIEVAIEGMKALLKPLYDLQQKELEMYGEIRYKPRMVLTLGNHEDRINRYVNDTPELEGFLSIDSLKYAEFGWEVIPFLTPIEIGGVFYCHYFQNVMTGKPLSGTAANMLKVLGKSFTMGHRQQLDITTRYLQADGTQQYGLIAGACYEHEEHYKGVQGNHHWRGVVVKHRVKNGSYDPLFVSLDWLKEQYGKD